MATTGNASVTRGAFIVLEGLDRSGKSTQVGLLEKRLKAAGREVRVMRFPGRFPCSYCVLSLGHWREEGIGEGCWRELRRDGDLLTGLIGWIDGR